MQQREIYNSAQMIELIQEIGFLPLLDSGISGYSAEEMVADDCRYVMLPDGGWDWPLWKWKGPLITRDLRAACGFNGPKMRSRFDSYVTRLQMACRIITEDFVYPTDKHGREYGWGWSLLTTPEQLHGLTSFECPRTPEESFDRILAHFKTLLPHASEKQILKLIK